MMESLRVWLLSLAGVALLTALASLFPTSESLRRITKLAGGVAVIAVGAATEVEMKEFTAGNVRL